MPDAGCQTPDELRNALRLVTGGGEKGETKLSMQAAKAAEREQNKAITTKLKRATPRKHRRG